MPDARMEDLIAQLGHEDPVMRIKACDGLRKLGDPTAISNLTGVYQNDSDPVVKEAAAEALRHFAKKEGGGGGSAGLRNLAVLLTLSLVVLVALNVVTRMSTSDNDGTEVDATPQAEPSDRDALLENYTEVLFASLDDLTALRAEWNAGAGSLPCTADLNRPQPLVVAEIDRHTYPDIAFVDDFNTALTSLQSVSAEWDAACASPELGTEEQLASATSALDGIEATLLEVGVAIDDAIANPMPTVAPPTSAATEAPPTPEASLEPTTPPEPTVVPTHNPELDPILRDLERIIGNTESELNALINSKWMPWQRGEVSPFGCAATNFDDPYTEMSAELLAQNPDLGDIIQKINGALATAQASADAYKTNCDANSLNQNLIADGIAQAQVALADIQSAQADLDRLYP